MKRFHPAAALFYFLCILILTMFLQSFFVAACSLVCAWAELFLIKNHRAFLKNVLFSLLAVGIFAATNPLFSHKGETVLTTVFDNNYTLEAVVYGALSGAMLGSTVMWLEVVNNITDREKMLGLFGKHFPTLTVLITMTMGFVPKIKRLYHDISVAQKGSGIYSSDSYGDKLAFSSATLTAVCGLSLESTVDTARSMKARGFGLKGRTSVHQYEFHLRDIAVMIFSATMTSAVLWYSALGYINCQFYPAIKTPDFKLVPNIAFLLICAMPAIIQVKERLKWKYCLAKI